MRPLRLPVGAKRRGNLLQEVPNSPKSIEIEKRFCEIATAPSGPRNDKLVFVRCFAFWPYYIRFPGRYNRQKRRRDKSLRIAAGVVQNFNKTAGMLKKPDEGF